MAHDEALADRLREHLQDQPGLTEKRMFGGVAFLIQGHMAVAASSKGGLMLRCDPQESAELIERPEAERMVMRGREMAGWLRIGLDADAPDDIFDDWVAVGVDYVRTLPPQ